MLLSILPCLLPLPSFHSSAKCCIFWDPQTILTELPLNSINNFQLPLTPLTSHIL
jgi:hypothetical protein